MREALEAATDGLRAAGVDSPRLDAELLLAAATGADRAAPRGAPGRGVEPAAARRFGEMVRRRVRREPVAYILGRKGFRHIELEVDGRVADPPAGDRAAWSSSRSSGEPLSVLEVGTGSGAIALAVADELPLADVVATDTSTGALASLARRTPARSVWPGPGVASSTGSLPAAGSFDLLLAQPALRDRGRVGRARAGAARVRALRGARRRPDRPGGDRRRYRRAFDLLRRSRRSAIALEVGEGQAPAVAEILRRAGYERVSTRQDLAGIERVVIVGE